MYQTQTEIERWDEHPNQALAGRNLTTSVPFLV
jgi:hypothetical protein